MAYAGYTGYDEEAVKRKRAIADALYKRSLDGRGQPIQHFTQGLAKLADAYMAREAMGEADAASTEFQDNRKAMADAMLKRAFPGAAGDVQAEEGAFDLTPGAMEQRQGYADQAQGMADLTGDPIAAMEYGHGLEDRDQKRRDNQLQREYLLKKLNGPIEVSKDATLWDPITKEPLYTAPGDGPKRQDLPSGMWYGPDGNGPPQPVPGYTEFYRGLHPGDGKGISLQFGEGGSLSELSIGGTGTNGKEPAIARGPGDQPVVTPSPQQLATNKSWQALRSADQKTKLVLDEIKLAKPLIGDDTTGAWSATKDLPLIGASTKSGQLAQRLKTIKANVGFDELQSMRENSPTGGALGQVAVQEIEFLQSVLGSLEQAQTTKDLTYNMDRLQTYLMTRADRRREAFVQDYPDLARYAGFAATASQQIKRINSDAEFAALPSGAEFIGPDSKKRRKP